MQTSNSLQRMYEELANQYAQQGEARQRDHCLVLAADAALTAGQPDQAERLRKRLLMTNPHHMLRPFTSMAEAMQSTDVLDYVADLRRHWPPEVVEKLLRGPLIEEETSTDSKDHPIAKPARTKAAEVPMVKKAPRETNSRQVPPAIPLTLGTDDAPLFAQPDPARAGFWVAALVFLLGLAGAGALAFFVLGGPFVE